jgi:hypothetical protein
VRSASRTRSLAAAALVLAAAGARAATPPDPWRALEGLRRELAERPLAGDFVQTFTPAGFASGETENGRLAVSMPDCLRWDYVEPFRKSFLVCGSRAWSWVEGEPRGQRVTIEARREMGLDLLLLPADELAARYRATVTEHAGGERELALEPLDDEAPLVAANLTLAAGGDRPTALDYRDREGNVTSFRFSNWRPLDDGDPFSPPPGIEWAEP